MAFTGRGIGSLERDDGNGTLSFIRSSVERYTRIKAGSPVSFQIRSVNGSIMADHLLNLRSLYRKRKRFNNISYKNIKKLSISARVKDLPKWQAINEKNKCLICLEQFKIGDYLTTLPCFHYFHETCIGTWLDAHVTCPLCKNQAIKKAKHPEIHNDLSIGVMPENIQNSPSVGFIGTSYIPNFDDFYERLHNDYNLTHPPVRILSYDF